MATMAVGSLSGLMLLASALPNQASCLVCCCLPMRGELSLVYPAQAAGSVKLGAARNRAVLAHLEVAPSQLHRLAQVAHLAAACTQMGEARLSPCPLFLHSLQYSASLHKT